MPGVGFGLVFFPWRVKTVSYVNVELLCAVTCLEGTRVSQ